MCVILREGFGLRSRVVRVDVGKEDKDLEEDTGGRGEESLSCSWRW